MQNLQRLTIDGVSVEPISVRAYEELLKIELDPAQINRVFPFKPETPRYQVNANDTPMGYYKVLSVKSRGDNQSAILSLHRQ